MYYSEVTEIFDQWSEEKPKQLINFIVEYLADDLYWLNDNISKVDRETFLKIAARLEQDK